MKIHVVLDDKDAIDGFVCVNIKSDLEALKSVITNSCTTIIASDILDKFPYEETMPILGLMIEKLRLGGQLILRGVGLLPFCRSVCSELISTEKAGELLLENKSFQDTRELCKALESAQLVVDSFNLNGISYEIIAKRNNGTL